MANCGAVVDVVHLTVDYVVAICRRSITLYFLRVSGGLGLASGLLQLSSVFLLVSPLYIGLDPSSPFHWRSDQSYWFFQNARTFQAQLL